MKQLKELKDVVTPVESETKQKAPQLSVLVITNRPKNFDAFIKQFSNTNLTILAVTDPETYNVFLIRNYGNVKIIKSKSRNFSYLVNLGARNVPTTHYILLADDENLKGNLLNLINCELTEETYKIFVQTFFGNEEIKMWSHYVPRVFAKTVKFQRRVHEFPIIRHCNTTINEIQIKNTSYADWDEYWKKAKSVVKREQKSLRRFVEILFTPVYWYFVNGRCSNGSLGIKIVCSSIIYAFLTLKYGINGHQYFPLSRLEQLYSLGRDNMCLEEKEYIVERIELLKAGNLVGQEDIAEEMEQLSSAL